MIFAEQRSCTTQFELGQMFRKAPEQSRDYSQSAQWFKRSAKQGYRKAQYSIGVMYARGLGVHQDMIKAYAWLKIAAAQGSHKAHHCLRKLANRMPMEQLPQAHALSREYYERYVAPFAAR